MTTDTHRLKSGINVYSDPDGVTLQRFSEDGAFTLHLRLNRPQALELTGAIEAALNYEAVPA